MKNLKWMILFLALVVTFTIPLTIQAGDNNDDDDDDERELLGMIQNRPKGLTGIWIIGDTTVEATNSTRFKNENGPLSIGACAKVKYVARNDNNYATTIKSEEVEKCNDNDDDHRDEHDEDDDRDDDRDEHDEDDDRDDDRDEHGEDDSDGNPPVGQDEYVVIGWNDLGMHCMDPSFEDFAVLPPYNTLWAQVIRRGEEPQIITSGVTVEYSIIDNTDSTSKTNFWDTNPTTGLQYAQQLFNLPGPLPPNAGLAGFGLSGQMHSADDHYVAEGIPLTEYRDSDPTTPYPYQLAEIVAKDSNGNVLATTQTVAPVSTEMHCEHCHDDNGSGNPDIAIGVLKQNILTLHDQEEDTTLMEQRPVLCAGCHSSNALGTTGEAGLPNLSLAMHGKHQDVTNDCYECHPGPQTKCLRGTMAEEGMTCQDCHGDMSDVANPARNPWLDEPACGDCHGDAHAEDPGKLFRFSTGHGGVYCQACHGSQHAIYPTMEHNDNIQSLMLQGKEGTLEVCTVCHTSTPNGEGPHGEGGESDSNARAAAVGIGVDIATEQNGDVNGDGLVNIFDLLIITGQFGHADSNADINLDGVVDLTDVTTAAGYYK